MKRAVAQCHTMALIAAGFASAGCSGHATVHMVPLGTRQVNPTGPLIYSVAPNECSYWTNEQGELCLAMRGFAGSLLGKRFERETLLSLVVAGLPAGSGRDYRMDRQTARVRMRAGYSHIRAGSTSGILTVWDYGQRVLRGRFRFAARQQSYSVLTGWSGNTAVLYVGEFAAVPDRARGEKLLARTEEGAMTRTREEPKPTPTLPSETDQHSK